MQLRLVCLKIKCMLIAMAALAIVSGCVPTADTQGNLEVTWGKRGVSDGRFEKPRAVAIDQQDNLYIVDMTARIQVFDRTGNFVRSWQIPEYYRGRPSGLSFNNAGNLLVADTHYNRMLIYTPDGRWLDKQTIGGEEGHGPGHFGFVTDAVQDSQGNYYIAEYGEYDRIQKFDSNGKYLFEWGSHGTEPGEFVRPQNLSVDEKDMIWVADACNHRIQVFDATGSEAKLVKIWGELGSEAGKLSYPYDLVLDGKGHVFIVEYGNHRVQKFTLDGESLGAWGIYGRSEGKLHNPWALTLDRKGRIHVLDSNNHRIQRIVL